MRRSAVLFAFCCLFSITALYSIDGTGNLTSGSINRTYSFHAPGAAVNANLPVVIMMHGDGGSGAGIKASCGMDAVADQNNFLVIYPDAVNGSWNRYVDNVPGDAGLGNPNAPDDVLFISDLIDHLCTTYSINANKVYASGHSAGGFMAYNLAVTLTDKVAAFAPVAGSLWGDNAFITNYFSNNPVEVPVLHIHGDADNVVDYPDPDHTPVAYEEWPLSGFSSPDCGAATYSTTTPIVTGVSSLIFCAGSTTEKRVELVRLWGQGHGWPAVANFNAAEYIWNFCNQYSLSVGGACGTVGLENENPMEKIFVYPVPAHDLLFIGGEVPPNSHFIITDNVGKQVMVMNNFNASSVYIQDLVPGIYFLTVQSGTYITKLKFVKGQAQ